MRRWVLKHPRTFKKISLTLNISVALMIIGNLSSFSQHGFWGLMFWFMWGILNVYWAISTIESINTQ